MAELHFTVIYVGFLLMTSSSFCNAQEVGTEPRVTLGVGTSASLPCAYENKVFAVYWKRSQLGPSEIQNDVVTLDARSTPKQRLYYMDGFNITDDYSLTLVDVSFEDEGRYFCIVSDYVTGTLITGFTDVTVESHARSDTVPNNVVWTHPRVALWEGQDTSSLPCMFQGTPSLVSWMRGESVDTAEVLIIWSNGVKTGVGFDDGSLDLTDDYGLVFRRVDLGIADKYICRVLNFNDVYIDNSTIVTVYEFQMQTASRLTVWVGETALLPCKLPYTPFRVHWLNASNGEVVASFTDGTFNTGNIRFSMDDIFSLAIREVSVMDEASLTCEVFTHDSRSWKNSTELTVHAYGEGPSFDGCQGSEYCSKNVRNREFQLSCSVGGAKPDVNISLAVAGTSDLTLLPASFKRREDGTRDQILYARVSMNLESSNETFMCTARGEAVGGIASAKMVVKVKSEGFPVAAVVAMAIMLILIVLGLVCFLVFKRTGFRTKRDICCITFSSQRDNMGNPDCKGNTMPLGEFHDHVGESEDQSDMPGDGSRRTSHSLYLTPSESEDLSYYSAGSTEHSDQTGDSGEGGERIHVQHLLPTGEITLGTA